VTKRRTHQEVSLFNDPARDSKKKKKVVRKIQTDYSDENGVETFCLVCMDGYSKSVAGVVRVQYTQCQMWAHEKRRGATSWGYICPSCKSDVPD
jgi:C4-type Zn-finger protein